MLLEAFEICQKWSLTLQGHGELLEVAFAHTIEPVEVIRFKGATLATTRTPATAWSRAAHARVWVRHRTTRP